MTYLGKILTAVPISEKSAYVKKGVYSVQNTLTIVGCLSTSVMSNPSIPPIYLCRWRHSKIPLRLIYWSWAESRRAITRYLSFPQFFSLIFSASARQCGTGSNPIKAIHLWRTQGNSPHAEKIIRKKKLLITVHTVPGFSWNHGHFEFFTCSSFIEPFIVHARVGCFYSWVCCGMHLTFKKD